MGVRSNGCASMGELYFISKFSMISPMLAHPLLRTPIYEKIILRILDTMEDLKEIRFSDDRTHVVLTGRGKHLLDEYENEMNQRLPFIISRKKFKRHTQEELAKAYRELNEYPD